MRISKRPITLLELMIAIGLTLVILTTVTFFYNQVVKINRQMDNTENNAFKMLYVENRLSSILPRVPPSSDDDIEFYFFTDTDASGFLKPGSQSLIFTFDNGAKLDKQMAYYVIGRLFVDHKGRLILACLPTPKRWKESEQVPMKKEILMENVTSLEFKFFIPQEKGKKKEGKINWPVGEAGNWISYWPKEIKNVPPLVKIIITRIIDGNKENITYVFHLPNTSQPITYDQ